MARTLVISAVLATVLSAGAPFAARAQDPAAIQAAVREGQRLVAEDRPAEATPLLRRAAEDALALWGDSSPDAGSLTMLWAEAVTDEGRLVEAEAIYRNALAMFERRGEPAHPQVGRLMNGLSLNLHVQGRHAEALAAVDRALEIRRLREGEDGDGTLVSLNNRAITLKALGRYGDADVEYRRVLAVREARLAADDPELATTLNNLGANLIMMDRAEEAETALRRAVAIREARLGPDAPMTAQSLSLLSDALASQGRLEAAEAMQRRALAALGSGGDGQNRTAAVEGLGQILLRLHRDAEAEPLMRQALDEKRGRLGPDHPETADAMVNVADVLILTGRHVEAKPLLVDAIRIRAARLGPDHPGLLQPLFLLSVAEGEVENRPAAITQLRRVWRIAETTLPTTHLGRIGAGANLGSALAADRQADEALPLLRQAADALEAKSGTRSAIDRAARQDLNAYRHVYRLTVTAAWQAGHPG